MRAALAAHDFATVFRRLSQAGTSQYAISALTGVAQPEVSLIATGRRKVQAFPVIARIVDGLGIPPCTAGLACGPCTRLHATGSCFDVI
jgi:hypothetical protein